MTCKFSLPQAQPRASGLGHGLRRGWRSLSSRSCVRLPPSNERSAWSTRSGKNGPKILSKFDSRACSPAKSRPGGAKAKEEAGRPRQTHSSLFEIRCGPCGMMWHLPQGGGTSAMACIFRPGPAGSACTSSPGKFAALYLHWARPGCETCGPRNCLECQPC